MTETCSRCGCPVDMGQREKHGAFHRELDRLVASVAEHHGTPECHEVIGRADVDLREQERQHR